MMITGNMFLRDGLPCHLRACIISSSIQYRERVIRPNFISSQFITNTAIVQNYGWTGTGAKEMLNLYLSIKRDCIGKVFLRHAIMGRKCFVSISNSTSEEEAKSRKTNKAIITMVESGELDKAHCLLSETVTLSNIDLDIDTFTSVMDGWVYYQEDLASDLNFWAGNTEDMVTQPYNTISNHVPKMIRAAERVDDILRLMERTRPSSCMQYNDHNKDSIDEETITLQKKHIVSPSSHHYDTVISSWTRIMKCESLSLLAVSNRFLLRGIPQRATTHLERMEHLALDRFSGVWPTVGTYNDVMESWSFSKEHRAAFMAESIFRRLAAMTKTKSEMGDVRDGISSTMLGIGNNLEEQSHRIMIRMWCKSGQNKGATFHATGHLIDLIDVVEDKNYNAEVTLEDYLLVFESWNRAP